jgi:hypothetical protein
MPRAYTLTPRPKNLSTTATLVHRLRHPLRLQRVRYPAHPLPNSYSVPTESDERRPPAEDNWLEEPTSQGSPYELVEIEDRGEYTEQRYGNVDQYWNSVMVEATPEEKERRRIAEEARRREKRNGRVFDNTEKLYSALNKPQQNQHSSSVTNQRVSLTGLTSPPAPTGNPDCFATQPEQDTNEDRYITLTENTSTAVLTTNQAAHAELTWNSALTQILASPGIDPSVASSIRARARDEPNNEVDMREVSIVPNFSYPIANARWSDACRAADWSCPSGSECNNSAPAVEKRDRLPYSRRDSMNSSNGDDITSLDPPQSNDSEPISASHRCSDPGSILRDILDPEELELYREIMSHNPRFTVLLDRAQKR